MTTAALAARVAKLEKTVAALTKQRPPKFRKGKKLVSHSRAPLSGLPANLSTDNVFQRREPGRDDWRSVVGIFDGDDVMKRIIKRGAAIRRAESNKARRG